MAEQKKPTKKEAAKKEAMMIKDTDLSTIRNKIRRNEMYLKQKSQKAKEKRVKRKRGKDDGGGEDGPPKVQKTLDNMRVVDETMVEADDEEVLQDACTDEFAAYFSGTCVPKVLFTTCNRP